MSLDAVVDRDSMTARVAETVYALHVVGGDTVEVLRDDRIVGTFSRHEGESEIRIRDGDRAALADVQALLAIGRVWFEQEVAAARARPPVTTSPTQEDETSGSPADPADERPRRAETGPRRTGSTVLVVAPDPSFRAFLALALRRRGHDVACAGSAGEARGLLARQFRVVVATASLPDGDGVALLALFRLRMRAQTVALVDRADETIPDTRAIDVRIDLPSHVVAILRAVDQLASAGGGAQTA